MGRWRKPLVVLLCRLLSWLPEGTRWKRLFPGCKESVMWPAEHWWLLQLSIFTAGSSHRGCSEGDHDGCDQDRFWWRGVARFTSPVADHTSSFTAESRPNSRYILSLHGHGVMTCLSVSVSCLTVSVWCSRGVQHWTELDSRASGSISEQQIRFVQTIILYIRPGFVQRHMKVTDDNFRGSKLFWMDLDSSHSTSFQWTDRRHLQTSGV